MWSLGPPILFQREDGTALPGFDFHSSMREDPELIWSLQRDIESPLDSEWAPGRVSNGQGLREDHEIAIPKPPGELRILFMGDSCTFGVGLRHVQGYVHRTEKHLAELFPDIRIECINAGVPGYSLYQGWLRLTTECLAYEPDVVVLAFGWNDMNYKWAGDLERFGRIRAAAPPEWLAWSRLARFVGDAITPGRKKDPDAEENRMRLEIDEFTDLLDKVRAETQRRGIELALLAWPGRFNVEDGADPRARTRHQAALLDYGKGLALGTIDGAEVVQRLRAMHRVEALFLDQVHGSGITNGAIARAVAERFEPWVREWAAR